MVGDVEISTTVVQTCRRTGCESIVVMVLAFFNRLSFYVAAAAAPLGYDFIVVVASSCCLCGLVCFCFGVREAEHL